MNFIREFIDYFIKQLPEIISFTGEHIYLTVITVVISVLVGIPLGISVYYYRLTSKIILSLANIIQAIPSLALLGFAIPLLGIGKLPSIVVVTLYSLLPIIKNTYIGINGIRPETIEAAKGMGLTKAQVLYKIQLPIALPVIMGGVRISAVTAVGVVTIAAFIGGGGLGYLIFSGIRTVNPYQILAGAIPACILALLVDLIFSKIESRLASRQPKKKKSNALRNSLILVAVVALGFGTYQGFLAPKYDITVASKDFSEQEILGHMLAEVIEEKTDLRVKRDLNLGGSSIVYEAIVNDHVDMYIDYTGTVFVSVLKNTPISNVDKVYKTISKDLKDKENLIVKKPIGFNNTFTLSVLPETAEKYNLKTISDLAKVSDKLTVSSTLEFANRKDGLKGLLKHYGMKFNKSIPIDGSSIFLALANKEADVISAYSTDGLIKKFNVLILEDDKHFLPPYYAVPIVRAETLEEHPELEDVLKLFDNLISSEEMQEMNYEVDELEKNPKNVARDFLKSKKIIK